MLLKLYEKNPDPRLINKIVDLLEHGGVIIYPTETLYGLGANPLYPDAIERLYTIKGRDQDKPIPFLQRLLETSGLRWRPSLSGPLWNFRFLIQCTAFPRQGFNKHR